MSDVPSATSVEGSCNNALSFTCGHKSVSGHKEIFHCSSDLSLLNIVLRGEIK